MSVAGISYFVREPVSEAWYSVSETVTVPENFHFVRDPVTGDLGVWDVVKKLSEDQFLVIEPVTVMG